MAEKDKKPEIRFTGFTDAWEQRKLGEITERVQGNDGRMDLPTLTISAASGWLDQRDRFYGNIAGREQQNYTLLKKGQLSYNHGNSKLAKYGIVFELQNLEEALVPRIYHSFSVNNKALASFIEYMFATKRPDKELSKLISSGARMDGLLNISYDDFMGIEIAVTSVNEQGRISEFFRTIDNLITLHQRKYDKLVIVKKSMLEKMFPKDGANVPEIRFAGFTDAWEQHKLGDMMNVTSVKRIHQSDWTNSGIRFLRARDIVSAARNEEPTDYLYISEDKYNEYSAISGKVKQGDLLVTGVGTIGVPMLIISDNPVYFKDGNIIWFKNENKIAGNFFYYSFISKRIQDFIKDSAGTGTVGTYTIESGKKTPIMLPEIKEQELIGRFLLNLDNLIILHQRELEKLKNIKKSMLEKMFV